MKYATLSLTRVVLTACAFLGGCASYKPGEIDPKTGQFASLGAVGSSEIRINKPMAGVTNVNFVYVRTISSHRPKELEVFVKDSLTKIGFARQVTEQELSKLVIHGGLSGEVQSLNNVIALHRLSKVTGPFLVAEFRVFRLTDVIFRFDVVIVDPVSGDTMFSLSRQKLSWIDFDKEMSYPVMNAVKAWFDESAKLPAPATLPAVAGPAV